MNFLQYTLLKFPRVKLGTFSKSVLTLSGVSIAGWYYLRKSYTRQFEDVFSGVKDKNIKCYNREEERNTIKNILNGDPPGIIFISGKINSGKTTTIKSVLKDRKFVAYINWRSVVTINSPQRLNEELKKAFRIKYFKDFLNLNYKFNFGKIIRLMNPWLPHIETIADPEMVNLKTTQDTIVEILRTAKILNNEKYIAEYKPVLFIDEISALRHLQNADNGNDTVENFIKWLVEITKDAKLCHVIVASSDGFAWDLFHKTSEFLDPSYFKVININDLTKNECQNVIKGFGNCKISEETMLEVGGHLGHINDLCRIGEPYINTIRTDEIQKLNEAYNNSSFSSYCYLKSYFKAPCYATDDFDKVMDFLKTNGGSANYYEVEKIILKRYSKYVLPALINNNYIFYSRADQTLSARNHVFMSEWQKKKYPKK